MSIKRLLIILLGVFAFFALAISPSFSTGLAERYNEKRVVEGIVLFFSTIMFFSSLFKYRLNFKKLTLYLWGILFLLLGISIFFSRHIGHSLLEIGWYVSLLQLTLVAAYVYQQYPQKFERWFMVALVSMVALYSVRVLGDLATGFTDPDWPTWPDHTRSVFIIDGVNIAKNGFLGFANVRFLNHLQTWSLPLLVYAYISFSPTLTKGFRILFIGLISFWWTLVFASGARGTLIASVLSVVILILLFRKQSLKWAKVYIFTLVTGVALYYILFKVLIIDGPGQELARTDSSGRLELWWATWQVIKQHTIWGLGPMHMASVQSANPITSPHNHYLMWAAEWGLLAFSAAFFIGAKNLWNWIKHSLGNVSSKNIAITASIIAGIMHSGASGLLITPLSQLLFAVILGWAVGLYFEERKQAIFVKKSQFSSLRNVFIASFLCLNLFVFMRVGLDVPFLQKNREKIKDLRRAEAITIFKNEKRLAGQFPRFWNQGFIGLEDVEMNKQVNNE